jgi:hypothetical protein
MVRSRTESKNSSPSPKIAPVRGASRRAKIFKAGNCLKWPFEVQQHDRRVRRRLHDRPVTRGFIARKKEKASRCRDEGAAGLVCRNSTCRHYRPPPAAPASPAEPLTGVVHSSASSAWVFCPHFVMRNGPPTVLCNGPGLAISTSPNAIPPGRCPLLKI